MKITFPVPHKQLISVLGSEELVMTRERHLGSSRDVLQVLGRRMGQSHVFVILDIDFNELGLDTILKVINLQLLSNLSSAL